MHQKTELILEGGGELDDMFWYENQQKKPFKLNAWVHVWKLIICENLFVASNPNNNYLFFFFYLESVCVHPAGLWPKSMKWIICFWWKRKWQNLLKR